MKVFWPRRSSDTGIIYGWTSESIAVVVAVLDGANALNTDASLANGANISKLVEQASELPRVIGRIESGCISLSGFNGVPDTVLYDPPPREKLHFLSLQPINLHRRVGKHDDRLHRLFAPHATSANAELALAIERINCADEFGALLTREHKRKDAVGNRILSSMSSFTSAAHEPAIRWLEATVLPCTSRLGAFSATAQQIELRTAQLITASREMQQAKHYQGSNSWSACMPYVAFWNCVWLLINDAIFGYATGTMMMANSQYIGERAIWLLHWMSEEVIRQSLSFLDSWPIGLKLNTQLSAFSHLVFLRITDFFVGTVDYAALMGLMSTAVWLTGFVGCFSMGTCLAMCSDLLTLLTLHIAFCYRISAATLRLQWRCLYLLFTLFRGKRRNNLRDRVDSWEYDIDQLILGTIMFTLVVFLMPTVLVYYSLFAALRLAILSIFAGVETALAFVNYFPLFALMLRIKDPARLPGGVYFLTGHMNADLTNDKFQATVTLNNRPIALTVILSHFGSYFARMGRHYHPARILWCFVTGRHLGRLAGARLDVEV